MGSQRVGHDWVTFTFKHNLQCTRFLVCSILSQLLTDYSKQHLPNLPVQNCWLPLFQHHFLLLPIRVIILWISGPDNWAGPVRSACSKSPGPQWAGRVGCRPQPASLGTPRSAMFAGMQSVSSQSIPEHPSQWGWGGAKKTSLTASWQRGQGN